MVDLSFKFGVVAAAVWLLTRGVTPAGAAAAHRAWLAAIATPLVWLAANALIAPFIRVSPSSVWPRIVTHPDAREVQAAAAIYGVVAAMLIARVVTGVAAVRRLLQAAAPLPAGDASRLRRLAGEASIDIREATLRVPVTAGFIWPAIVLPLDWRTLSTPALTAILRHEAAHVRRRDCLVALGCALVEAVIWFHPAVWLATARTRWFAEMACDADAAGAMASGEYAAQLLALADRWNGADHPTYAITAGAGTGVSDRLRLLLQELECGARRRRALLIAPAVILMLLALARVDIAGWSHTGEPEFADHPAHHAAHRQHHSQSALSSW